MKLTRTPAGLAATAMLAVTLAACGGGQGNATNSDDDEIASLGTTATPDGPDGTAPEGTTVDAQEDPEAAMLAYTECMREQGIDMPDPITNGDGAGGAFVVVEDTTGGVGDMEDFMAAEEECSPLLEAAMSNIEIDPEQEAELRENMLAFTECMREQGIDMPDPVFNEDGDGMSVQVHSAEGAPMGAAEPFEPDPEMEAAMEACGQTDSEMAAAPVGGGS
ncbi:MAG: hypothetical protein M3431_08490 [Actinomycetota bacterium]|nr:hypothetical protein [Actinomycetota bacterium]